MRKLVFLIPVAMAAGFFIFNQNSQTSVVPGVDSSPMIPTQQIRGPASMPKADAFSFSKYVSVKFDFDPKSMEQKIAGYLYLKWDGDRVQASLNVADQPTDVFIEGEISDRVLRCVSVPELVTEEESNMVVLLKNLLLDYAYKTQRDENGAYAATIEGKKKIKLRYLDKKEFKVENSLHVINQNDISGDETIVIKMNEKSSHVRTKYGLKAVKASRLSLTPRKMTPCLEDFSILGKVLKKASISELREGLSNLSPANRGRRQEMARIILKNLRADETQLQDFLDWVHEHLEDRQLSALAIGMLGNLGTVTAQNELVTLFNNVNEKTSHVQHQVLNAFTLIEKPLSAEARDFLKGQLGNGPSDLKEGAAYALGTSIQNNPGSPEAKADFSLLRGALEGARNTNDRLIYMDALNNSGSPEAKVILQKYTSSSDPQIRQKAQELLSM